MCWFFPFSFRNDEAYTRCVNNCVHSNESVLFCIYRYIIACIYISVIIFFLSAWIALGCVLYVCVFLLRSFYMQLKKHSEHAMVIWNVNNESRMRRYSQSKKVAWKWLYTLHSHSWVFMVATAAVATTPTTTITPPTAIWCWCEHCDSTVITAPFIYLFFVVCHLNATAHSKETTAISAHHT